MARMLNFFEKLFKTISRPALNTHEKYLSQSRDLADLETRMKEMRNSSPNYKYRYWI